MKKHEGKKRKEKQNKIVKMKKEKGRKEKD